MCFPTTKTTAGAPYTHNTRAYASKRTGIGQRGLSSRSPDDSAKPCRISAQLGGPDVPQSSAMEFHALPLRVHTFLAGVPLHDVWAVDLPHPRERVTLAEFQRLTRQRRTIGRLPASTRALFGLRFFLGRIFRLEGEPKDA